MTTTKKYNKKEIFKASWNLVKRQKISFSEALKKTWELTKKVVAIKAKELAERIEKLGAISLSYASCQNQSDFSACETRKVTGVYQSTIAR